jgi:hypothetical protein
VVKSCRKGWVTVKVLLKAKAAALHPKTVPELTIQTIYKKGGLGEAGKRSAGNWIGQPIRSTDGQVENRPMGADT